MSERTGIAAFIEARMRADRVPGLAVAVIGDDIRRQRGFGAADLSTGAPVGPDTVFLWFSMTKIVAVRHLLSHSSGLANPIPIRWVHPADTPGPDQAAFTERLLHRHTRLKFRPGTRAAYSNLGYLVLGEVVAQVTGGTYEGYVRRHILTPLGMSGTGLGHRRTDPGRAATGYQPLAAPLTPLLRAVLPAGIVGARHKGYVAYRPFRVSGHAYGGLIGPAGDAARLAFTHLDHGQAGGARILSAAAAAAMQQIQPRGGPMDFGLGWFRRHGAPPDFAEHLGGGSGFFNVMRIYPKRRLAIVLMGNTTRFDHEPIIAAILDPARAGQR